MHHRVKIGCGGADKPGAVNKERRSLFFIVAAFIDEIKLSVALKCARTCLSHFTTVAQSCQNSSFQGLLVNSSGN